MRVMLSTEVHTIEISAPGSYGPEPLDDMCRRAMDMLLTAQAADRIVAEAEEAKS